MAGLLFSAIVSPPGAQAQDSGSSNASFWLQERERSIRAGRSGANAPPRPQTKVRRLVPNKRLARPTIWRAAPEKTLQEATPTLPSTAVPAPTVESIDNPNEATSEARRDGGEIPAFPNAPSIPPSIAAQPQNVAAQPQGVAAQPPNSGPPKPGAHQEISAHSQENGKESERGGQALSGNADNPPGIEKGKLEPLRPEGANSGELAGRAPNHPTGQPNLQSIVIVGDSLAYMLAQGMMDAKQERPAPDEAYAIVRKARDSSGLVRDDFFDWQKGVREIIAAEPKIAAVAIMIGSNDRQELRDAAGRYEPFTPRWRDLYQARVAQFLAPLQERKIPFFWIGLPIMKSDRYSADMAQLNEIYKSQTEIVGGKFVDSWDVFADDKGRFTIFGPDMNGQIVRLRAGDGVHFSRAGARKLAFFADQAMRPLLEKFAKPTDGLQAIAPGQDPPAVLRGENVVLQKPPQLNSPALQSPPAPAQPPSQAPRPAFGPVFPLTAIPFASGSELDGAGHSEAARSSMEAKGANEKATAQTTAIAPSVVRHGRADDFTWPKSAAPIR